MNITVALCGWSPRFQRLLEIVLAGSSFAKHKYVAQAGSAAATTHIAIADLDSSEAELQVSALRASNHALLVLCVSDSGLLGDSTYRLERRSLMLQLGRQLDRMVDEELTRAFSTLDTSSLVSRHNTPKPSDDLLDQIPAMGFAAHPPLQALVVDDSLTVREQLRQSLARAGIRSDLADCAKAALECMSYSAYDIVFLDVVMPGADGYEVCRQIKRNPETRSTPVLMLTSRSSPFDRARGALAGCDSYLVKPITWDSFFAAVDKVLAKQFRNDRALLNARGYRTANAN